MNPHIDWIKLNIKWNINIYANPCDHMHMRFLGIFLLLLVSKESLLLKIYVDQISTVVTDAGCLSLFLLLGIWYKYWQHSHGQSAAMVTHRFRPGFVTTRERYRPYPRRPEETQWANHNQFSLFSQIMADIEVYPSSWRRNKAYIYCVFLHGSST